MTKEEYAKVVAANMRRIMYDREKTQADLARDLHLNKSTVSSWMNGTRTPKIDKIDLLCEYLSCTREDLMEPRGKRRETVTASQDQADLVQLVMRAHPDNVKMVLALLRRLEGDERS
jgi:transcriptional regulator with XRE-family HTH domain